MSSVAAPGNADSVAADIIKAINSSKTPSISSDALKGAGTGAVIATGTEPSRWVQLQESIGEWASYLFTKLCEFGSFLKREATPHLLEARDYCRAHPKGVAITLAIGIALGCVTMHLMSSSKPEEAEKV